MYRVEKVKQASFSKLPDVVARLAAALATILCLNSCRVPEPAVQVDGDADTIQVGTAEIFENADLQSSLDAAKVQLASMTLISGSSVTAALGNIQGFNSSQSGIALQAIGSPTPQVQTTAPGGSAASAAQVVTTQSGITPAAPAAISAPATTAPTLAPAASTLLDRQLQLTSQVAGYELLLTGSDFSRFTTSGAPRDRIVIGIPISIYPGKKNYDQAAQVTIQYFAPNSLQFKSKGVQEAKHG